MAEAEETPDSGERTPNTTYMYKHYKELFNMAKASGSEVLPEITLQVAGKIFNFWLILGPQNNIIFQNWVVYIYIFSLLGHQAPKLNNHIPHQGLLPKQMGI